MCDAMVLVHPRAVALVYARAFALVQHHKLVSGLMSARRRSCCLGHLVSPPVSFGPCLVDTRVPCARAEEDGSSPSARADQVHAGGCGAGARSGESPAAARLWRQPALTAQVCFRGGHLGLVGAGDARPGRDARGNGQRRSQAVGIRIQTAARAVCAAERLDGRRPVLHA